MSIQHIMQISKDFILEHGVYCPTLFVDFASSRTGKQFLLDALPASVADLHKAMFAMGREQAQAFPDEDLASLCFVVEVYGTHIEGENEPTITERRECLLFQYLRVLLPNPGSAKKNLELSLHFVELIRDGRGNLIDLLVEPEPAFTSAHQLLPVTAFLAGWSEVRMPERKRREIKALAKRSSRNRRIRQSWAEMGVRTHG